ncbi:hypothetical protein IOD40_10450 [Aquamicrobium sp. cd-1]|uniref:Cyclic nucleotide-binding domain-containing protein n=2 Tax=Aquamicrobium zhengzhouense TaxID=2781738 RepID=A0ABS0SCT8_9HYPH|nr:hypothetical protein [Aquamicrobium zhengzhouense]
MGGFERHDRQARSPSLLTMASRYAERPSPEPVAPIALDEQQHSRPQALETPEPSTSDFQVEALSADPAQPFVVGAEEPSLRSRLASPLVLAMAGALAGAAISLAWPQNYTATSELLIDQGEVENHLHLLRSGSLLSAVADKLNLVADPEFNGASTGPLALFSADVASQDQRRRSAIRALGSSLRIEQSGASSVITVSASSAEPQKAAQIANTIAAVFVEKNGGSVVDEARISELQSAVAQAEHAIESFKARHELVDAQGRLITDDEIQRLSEELSAARARTVELNARASSTRDANVDSIVTGSLPEQVASPTLAELRARFAAARQQLDRISVKLGPRHPERLAAEAEVEAARQEIAGELRRVAGALQTDLKRAVEQEQQLASQLAQMKVRQGSIGGELVELRELERQAAAKRSAYEQALHAAQPGAIPTGTPSIISMAEPPSQTTAPSLWHLAGAGGFAGLLLGFARTARTRRREDDDNADMSAAIPDGVGVTPEPNAVTEPPVQHTGEGTDAMYAYPTYPHPYLAEPQPSMQPQGIQHAHAGVAPTTVPVMAPQAAVPPMWPQMHPAHYPYTPMAPMPAPYDPWAHMRGWPQMMPPAMPQAQPAPQVFIVQLPQQPVNAAPAAAFQQAPMPTPAASAPRQQQASENAWTDQSAFIDERTDAAIEEIRRSLREFREVIEGFAEERSVYNLPQRRHGT